MWQGFHRLDPSHPDYGRIRAFAAGLARQYRVFNFDARAAEVWGEITAGTPGPLPVRDSLIAAIARSRGCRVVTRDAALFERLGCNVVNPWRVAQKI